MLATTRALQFDRRPPDAEAVSAPLTTLGSAPHTDQTRMRLAEAQPWGAPPPAAVAKPLRARPRRASALAVSWAGKLPQPFPGVLAPFLRPPS